MVLVRFLTLVGAMFLLGFGPVNAQQNAGTNTSTQEGETYLLAIGVCPPYRKFIPVKACSNGVEAIVSNFKTGLNIKEANVISLVDEKSSGANVLKAINDLSNKLKPEDRLMVYLLMHGDAFYQWAGYYQPDQTQRTINSEVTNPNEDLLVFWTKEEPTVPALAIAQKDWWPASELVAALETIPARIGLILDSCSSNLVFQAFHGLAAKSDRIDYILTSSGSEQASNFNASLEAPLFGQELANAMSLPNARTFGQVVEHARMTTVLHAVALCSTVTFEASNFSEAFPSLPVPQAQTVDGQVSPPLWFCAQVPTVADYSGELTNRKIAGATEP